MAVWKKPKDENRGPLADQLNDELHRLHRDADSPTVKDVHRQILQAQPRRGVSPSTVHKALSGDSPPSARTMHVLLDVLLPLCDPPRDIPQERRRLLELRGKASEDYKRRRDQQKRLAEERAKAHASTGGAEDEGRRPLKQVDEEASALKVEAEEKEFTRRAGEILEQAERERRRIRDRAEEEAFALKTESQEQAEEIYAEVREIEGLKRQHKELCVRVTRWRAMELQTAQELGRIALEEQSRVEALSWDGVDVPQAVQLPELDGQEQESGPSLFIYLPGQRVGDDPVFLESDPLDPGP